MSIIDSLLIFTRDLQQYLAAKDGTPLSGGLVTCYEDDDRTVLKNWYYQTGNLNPDGSYQYAALPNPLTLSAAGTVCDVNGNDCIPGYYPFSEVDNVTPQLYYI